MMKGLEHLLCEECLINVFRYHVGEWRAQIQLSEYCPELEAMGTN